MLKKILYIIGSFMLGFLLIIIVMNTTVINVLQTRIKDAVNTKNYAEAKRYFSGIYDKTTNFVLSGENGEHIEIYYGMANANHTFKKDSGEDASYTTVETGVHFVLFNLTEDFKLADEEGKQGGVKLYFDNGDLFFPFVKGNYNFYNLALSFSFLPFSIEYQEFTQAVEKHETITLDSAIKSVDILDGTGNVKFTFDEEKTSGLTFDNDLYKTFAPILADYNQIQKDAANGKEVSEETQKDIMNRYSAAKGNPNYVSQYEQSEIFGSADFLVPVIIAAVIFLALDILVAWLLFRKKKVNKYVPPYQKPTTTTKTSEPEQFTRDVFNVENFDEIESSEELVTTEKVESGEEVVEEKPTTEE